VGVIALLVSSLAVAQAPIVFQEDFEYGQGGFEFDNNFGNGDGLWHISASCRVPDPGHTQDGALYYGRDGGCDYNNGETNQGVALSPTIDLTGYISGPIELHFMYFLDTENYSAERDIASVEVSKNGGGFVTVAHKYTRPDSVLLTNNTTAWTECIVDLTAYAGSTIQLRFGLDTYDPFQNDYEGFFVDDVIVYGPPCPYTIVGDSNGDCVVNLVDIAALAQNWLLNCYLTPEDPGCVPE
jgi:hypothetical protein